MSDEAERAIEQVAHATNETRRLHGLGLQFLTACEGEKALRERGAALGALHGVVEKPQQPRLVGQSLAQ